MKANSLDESYGTNATILSQIETWREKAVRRFNAGLIDEKALTNCMRSLDRLEDDCESAELSLVGINEEERLKVYWKTHRVKKYMWSFKKNPNPHGRGAKYAN